MMSRLHLLLLLSLAACDGDGDGDTKDSPDTGSSGETDLSEPDWTGFEGDADGTEPATLVIGQVTWTLTFDDEAQSLGFTDCSYTRTFRGVQYNDMGYLCPECTVQVSGTATMTEGLDDCYSQISSDTATERDESWGWSDGAFYRAGRAQFPLGELATFSDAGPEAPIALSWESESDLTDGGSMVLSASGELLYKVDDGVLVRSAEPALPDSYACGWPQNDPGDLELDYALGVGKTFPNVYLKDQCGETVKLWDLYGSWLVLDSSQSDCGPCQTMADGAEAFVAQMAQEGIEVRVVSLLGNGLSDPFGTPSESTLSTWVDAFSLTDPVLYDRGFAYAMFPQFIADYSGESFGFPAWLVVSPEMELIHGNVGFSSWDAVGDIIRAAE